MEELGGVLRLARELGSHCLEFDELPIYFYGFILRALDLLSGASGPHASPHTALYPAGSSTVPDPSGASLSATSAIHSAFSSPPEAKHMQDAPKAVAVCSLNAQRATATALRRAEVKLDACAQLFEAGS